MSQPVRLAADVQADLGEAPHWDSSSGSLLFVDIPNGLVYRFDVRSGLTDHFSVGDEIGAIIPRQAGGYIIALRKGIATLDGDGSNLVVRAAIEPDQAGTRLNDAKCDPKGRLFAGTTSVGGVPCVSALYRITENWDCTVVASGVTYSNGLAWSPAAESMYYIDSAARGVDVFQYDVNSGTAYERRRLLDIPPELGTPDGMTVDCEGNLWIACFGGGAVRCYSPRGLPLEVIKLPVTQPTSCAFGGENLSELYITTAAYRLSRAELRQQPNAGGLFVCVPGVRGLPANSFTVA